MRITFDDSKSWPAPSLIEVMTGPKPQEVVTPVLRTLIMVAAHLILIANEEEQALRLISAPAAEERRQGLTDFAIRVTDYFAKNISCLAFAEDLSPAEARQACGVLTHSATVACKVAPQLLWHSDVSNAVAKGFDDYLKLPEGARDDQDAMMDGLILHLTNKAPTETPEHLSTLADAMVAWSRKQPLPASGDPALPATARAEAAARLIYNRLGMDAERALNPLGRAA